MGQPLANDPHPPPPPAIHSFQEYLALPLGTINQCGQHVSDELSSQMYCTIKLSLIIIEEMQSFQDGIEHAISIISHLNIKTLLLHHVCILYTHY